MKKFLFALIFLLCIIGGLLLFKDIKNDKQLFEDIVKLQVEDLYNNLNSFSLSASYEERTEEKRV